MWYPTWKACENDVGVDKKTQKTSDRSERDWEPIKNKWKTSDSSVL